MCTQSSAGSPDGCGRLPIPVWASQLMGMPLSNMRGEHCQDAPQAYLLWWQVQWQLLCLTLLCGLLSLLDAWLELCLAQHSPACQSQTQPWDDQPGVLVPCLLCSRVRDPNKFTCTRTWLSVCESTAFHAGLYLTLCSCFLFERHVDCAGEVGLCGHNAECTSSFCGEALEGTNLEKVGTWEGQGACIPSQGHASNPWTSTSEKTLSCLIALRLHFEQGCRWRVHHVMTQKVEESNDGATEVKGLPAWLQQPGSCFHWLWPEPQLGCWGLP